jgi:hypothetical protein
MIRELEKNNSKLENGHFVFAHDSNVRLIEKLKDTRSDAISNLGGKDSEKTTLLENVGFLDKLIRELEKINSKIENGNMIFAWRDNRRVLAEFARIKNDMLSEKQK